MQGCWRVCCAAKGGQGACCWGLGWWMEEAEGGDTVLLFVG